MRLGLFLRRDSSAGSASTHPTATPLPAVSYANALAALARVHHRITS